MKTYNVEIKLTSEGLRLNNQLCKIHRGKVVTIENNSVGIGHSAHANIDASGSVKGMKSLGYWGKNDVTLKQGGFIYNLSTVVISDPLDALALYLERGGEMWLPKVKNEWSVYPFSFTI
jgi:hypothetical protein